MISALQEKLVQTVSSTLEEDRKGRSVVIAGLPEEPRKLPASRRQAELEDKVGDSKTRNLGQENSDAEVLGGLNYKLIRSDRGCQRGGGVCCLVRDLRLQVKSNHLKQSFSDVLARYHFGVFY
ncbi:hypothetical protein COOONC_27176 [Cooperia oncophora]